MVSLWVHLETQFKMVQATLDTDVQCLPLGKYNSAMKMLKDSRVPAGQHSAFSLPTPFLHPVQTLLINYRATFLWSPEAPPASSSLADAAGIHPEQEGGHAHGDPGRAGAAHPFPAEPDTSGHKDAYSGPPDLWGNLHRWHSLTSSNGTALGPPLPPGFGD